MSSTPAIQAQSLVTQPVVTLIEFDFSSINYFGTPLSGSVYIANSKESAIVNGQYVESKINWDGNTYEWMDLSAGGFKSDLLGSPNEPTLRVASSLFELPNWQYLPYLSSYYNLTVWRQRLFYNTLTTIAPEKYYVKKVELNDREVTFTLSGSMDLENLSRPSARKLSL